MALVLNEEQRLLQDTAREFLKSNAPVEALRQLRDSRDETGYSMQLWQEMAERARLTWRTGLYDGHQERWARESMELSPSSASDRPVARPGLWTLPS